MASLDREVTAGPTPPRARRWSEYTQLSRQIKQASLLNRRHGYYTAKISLNLVLLAAGGAVFVALEGLLVAAGDRRLPGGRLYPDRLRRPRSPTATEDPGSRFGVGAGCGNADVRRTRS
jgi:hypothetical protein